MKITQLTSQDLEDILVGATLLGAGGGGPRVVGQQILDALVKQGSLPTLVAVGDLEPGAWGAVSAFAGSPDAASTGPFDWSPATRAFAAMAAWGQGAGKPMAFVLPVELGGGNTFIPLAVAASLSPPLPVVDGAGARRAVPGLNELSYAAPPAVPVSPMVLCSPTDQMSVEVSSAQVADNVLRAVVSAGGFDQEAGIALWPMTGATAATSVVAGTTTYAQGLGAAIRVAPPGGAIAAAVEYTQGVVLGRGTISAVTAQTAGGFDTTTIVVACADGTELRVFAQNENLIAYSSASPAPLAMAPDLLGWITPQGTTFSNADPELVAGTDVALLAMPCPPAMRTPFYVDQFLAELRAAGYGGPYVPLIVNCR
ncbi:MAG TPA: DUF917 family protein [Kofleriaceae bacterium]|jgi:DUF917 family protein|nr:DUF917 family protein [Kofleriaceae bacterium]